MEIRVYPAAGAPGVAGSGSGSFMGWYLGKASILGEMRHGGPAITKQAITKRSVLTAGRFCSFGRASWRRKLCRHFCKTSWHSSRKAQGAGEGKASRRRAQHKQRWEEESRESCGVRYGG